MRRHVAFDIQIRNNKTSRRNSTLGLFNFFKRKEKNYDAASLVIGWLNIEASKLIGHPVDSKGYRSAFKSAEENIKKFVLPILMQEDNKALPQEIFNELSASCGKRATEAFGAFCFLLWVRLANIQIAIAQGRVKADEATPKILIEALFKQVKKVSKANAGVESDDSDVKSGAAGVSKTESSSVRLKPFNSGAEMTEEGLKQVSIAIRSGAIELQKGQHSSDIFAHADTPMGTPRITYVMFNPLDKSEVIARCVLIFDRLRDEIPVWQIDWAVLSKLRGKGFGSKIARNAITEFCGGMLPKSKDGFFIEAVVDEGNAPSICIARKLIGNEEVIFNESTGANVYSYMCKIEN